MEMDVVVQTTMYTYELNYKLQQLLTVQCIKCKFKLCISSLIVMHDLPPLIFPDDEASSDGTSIVSRATKEVKYSTISNTKYFALKLRFAVT